ncbi:hypothetical protein SKAU_G00010020 [Synaphobranchus kaupii]|uniref:PP1-binding domain-containing protein n=1 Tax=Synaphobranchus kaupii TaxID=118154 RepID=A0A9Q1G9S3_SYNKA|nr:hypothetical protein SKAU_G00010020 [Synaphobranchus kaupii]
MLSALLSQLCGQCAAASAGSQLGHGNRANLSFIGPIEPALGLLGFVPPLRDECNTYLLFYDIGFKGGEMASTELNFDIDEDEQKWKAGVSDGLAFCSPPTHLLYNKPLDFSQVTPSQLGISAESFVPSSQGKDKSRLSQLKLRRRSTVGARGSPETNSLIRYIAQQRQKTPPSTPQPRQASPFFSCGSSTLKQKMASFQNIMEIEENPRPAEEKESDGHTSVGGKENWGPQGCPIPAAPPCSKRRRTGPFQDIVLAPPASLDILSPRLTPGYPEQVEVGEVCTDEPSYAELTSFETEEAVCWSPLFPGPRSSDRNDVPFSPTHCSPAEARRQSWRTGPQSPCLPLTLGPVDLGSSESLPSPSPFPLTTRPGETAADEVAECAGNSARPKRKRVHFGVPLSPEFFDKRLPPSTPLQKGGTPAHLLASGGPQLRSLLKTPQKSALSLPQPDFGSPSLTGPSSPSPSGLHDNEVQTICTEEQVKITVPVGITDPAVEEAVGSHEDTDVAPGLCEESNQRKPHSPDVTPTPPQTLSGEAETGVELKTELAPSPAPEPPVNKPRPARSRSRKRKAEVTDPAAERRPSRNAAVSASGKMKGSAGKRRWGSKEVDRSLYGKRDYASKNPTLSPITETLSCAPTTMHPQTAETPEDSGGTPNPSIPLVQTGRGDLAAGVVAAAALWRRRFCIPAGDQAVNGLHDGRKAEESAGLPAGDASDCAAEATAPAASADPLFVPPPPAWEPEERRGSRGGRGACGRSRRGKGRRKLALSSPYAEDQTATGTEPFRSPASPDRSSGNRQDSDAQVPDASVSGGLSGEEEHGVSDSTDPESEASLALPKPASGGGQRSNAAQRSRATDRLKGRRSSLFQPRSRTEEEEDGEAQSRTGGGWSQEEEGREVRGEGGEISDRATETRGVEAGADGDTGVDEIGQLTVPPMHVVGGAEQAPPPWQQAEFCIEDVLRAPPREGRRSVRRSLRNQSHQDPSAIGLAWVPRSSPTDLRPARRRTRGRRSSARATPTLPEDPAL